MNRILCSTILAAAAALAGCDQSDHTITANGPYDPNAGEANAAAVNLPPPIAASHTYRCRDNSLVYVDWYGDGTARLKSSPTEAGIPTTAEDLKGGPDSATITANGQTCRT